MSHKDGKGPHGEANNVKTTPCGPGQNGRRAVYMICSHVIGTACAVTMLPEVDSNHRSPKTADLQSAAFDLFAISGIQETASLLRYER